MHQQATSKKQKLSECKLGNDYQLQVLWQSECISSMGHFERETNQKARWFAKAISISACRSTTTKAQKPKIKRATWLKI